MIEAKIALRIPRIWLSEVPARHDVQVKVLDRRASGKHGVRDLVEVTGANKDLRAVLDDLRNEPWVTRFDMDFVDERRLVGDVVTYKCLACAALAGSNSHLMSAKVGKDGTIVWMLMTRDREELQSLFSKLKKVRCEVELLKVTSLDDTKVLTDRQEEITMMAFERGYFDTPRRVKLRDLAEATGVSQATLSEILRKGQKRIVVEYMRGRRKGL